MVIDIPRSNAYYKTLHEKATAVKGGTDDPAAFYLVHRFAELHWAIKRQTDPSWLQHPQKPEQREREIAEAKANSNPYFLKQIEWEDKQNADWKHNLSATPWKNVVPKITELHTLIKEHGEILKNGREGVADKWRGQVKNPQVGNDLGAAYHQHLPPQMFPVFIREFEAGSKVMLNGKALTIEEMRKMDTEALRSDKMKIVSKDGTEYTEGNYLRAYTQAVDETLKIERLQEKFITAVKSSPSYKKLPEGEERTKYLAGRLMETYDIGPRNEGNSVISVHVYFPSPNKIALAVAAQEEENKKTQPKMEEKPVDKVDMGYFKPSNPTIAADVKSDAQIRK